MREFQAKGGPGAKEGADGGPLKEDGGLEQSGEGADGVARTRRGRGGGSPWGRRACR